MGLYDGMDEESDVGNSLGALAAIASPSGYDQATINKRRADLIAEQSAVQDAMGQGGSVTPGQALARLAAIAAPSLIAGAIGGGNVGGEFAAGAMPAINAQQERDKEQANRDLIRDKFKYETLGDQIAKLDDMTAKNAAAAAAIDKLKLSKQLDQEQWKARLGDRMALAQAGKSSMTVNNIPVNEAIGPAGARVMGPKIRDMGINMSDEEVGAQSMNNLEKIMKVTGSKQPSDTARETLLRGEMIVADGAKLMAMHDALRAKRSAFASHIAMNTPGANMFDIAPDEAAFNEMRNRYALNVVRQVTGSSRAGTEIYQKLLDTLPSADTASDTAHKQMENAMAEMSFVHKARLAAYGRGPKITAAEKAAYRKNPDFNLDPDFVEAAYADEAAGTKANTANTGGSASFVIPKSALGNFSSDQLTQAIANGAIIGD